MAALQIFITPLALFWSAVTGIVFALCFSVACGLGNGYLRKILEGYPVALYRPVYVVYNAVAASLACALSFGIVTHLPSTNIRIVVPFFWRIVAIDGVIGAILALIIGAFIKLKLQVEESQMKVRELAVATGLAGAGARPSIADQPALFLQHSEYNFRPDR